MFQYILTLVLMLSLGAILYLVARSLPRVGLEKDEEKDSRGLVERWVTSEIPEKADEILNSFLFKFFRRLKLFLLKVDNALGKKIEKVKPNNSVKRETTGADFRNLTALKKDKKE